MYYQNQGRGGRGGGGGGRNRGGRGGGGGGWGNNSYKQKESLAAGMQGFLCTCNFNERDCVKDAYNLLNEYWEKTEEAKKLAETPIKPVAESDEAQVEGKAADSTKTTNEENSAVGVAGASKPEESEDFEADLNAEIRELNSSARKHRFNSIQSGARNLVFISTTVEDPSGLAHTILEDLFNKKEQKSRSLLRLLPIEATCYTKMDEIRATAKTVLQKYFFPTLYQSYQVAYKCRYNDSLNRDEIIRTMAEVVSEINPLSVVNLTNPQLVVIVEIVKTTMCIGVARDFIRFKKYNLIEAATPEGEKVGQEAKVSEVAIASEPLDEDVGGAQAEAEEKCEIDLQQPEAN